MADKKLSKDVWVGFTKKLKLSLDDSALIKALEKFDKTDEGHNDARASALEGIVEQVKKQVAALVKAKKDLGDKPFGETKDKLYELLDEAEKQQKAANKSAASSAEEEEEDSPALLTTAMIPLVRLLHKGEVQMHGLIAVGSKKAAVLIMRRAISPSRRKLLAEYLQESGGLKYFAAEVAGSAGQLEFLLDSSPGGLSKKLRQAVLDQTGLRSKVFVQFGEETETDGEESAESEGGEVQASEDEGHADDAALITYQQRLEALAPRYLQALKGAPELAGKLRALHGFADGKAEAGQYAVALKSLDALEGLLATAEAAVATQTTSKPDRSGAQVLFTQTRLDWDSTRKTVLAELQELEAEILEASREEPDLEDIRGGTKNLFAMLETLDTSLIDKLDEAINALDPAQRKALHGQALEIVGGYRKFIRSDALLRDIDDNGFLELDVRETLDLKLAAMAAQLDASLSLY
jgi:hypothetical protein